MYRLLSGVYHRRWYKVCYFACHAHLGILLFKYLAKSLWRNDKMYRLLSGVYHRRWYKVCYFARHAHLGILPFKYLAKSLDDVLAEYAKQPKEIQQSIMQRVNYYNKLNCSIALSGSLNKVGYFKKHGSSQYFFDLANLLRYFPKGTSFAHQFGDVTHIPEQPTLVKSRPIFVGEENANSVILKLDSVRHFYIYPDPFNFSQKLDKLIWRGGGTPTASIGVFAEILFSSIM
ncbi:hypothetical protein [Histophilus somni]|uniref:hypothetical protein n=1 Tax=Histophilus somni TaxID=731 RepID=UPI000AA5774E|nr:hypothetical protein [Histophilus somni]